MKNKNFMLGLLFNFSTRKFWFSRETQQLTISYRNTFSPEQKSVDHSLQLSHQPATDSLI